KRDGNHYVINGRKSMISRNLVADVFAVACRTGEKAGDISIILVESTTPGFRRGRAESFITRSRTSHAGDLTMTDCQVPVENRIGEENHGLELILGAHNDGGGAGVCLGIAQAALELGVKYAKERHLYGKPLTELQTILFWLGDMERQTQRARWLCYHAAWLLDQGKKSMEIPGEMAMAKLDASEAALNNCLKAIELMGAYGTTPELGIIRKFKYALDMIADGGSNQVLRLALSSSTVRRY
ncbi:acyl-CoA dehydrogenase family protein, partial [Chloroflexota bacterium]